jgi:hypothetical protein
MSPSERVLSGAVVAVLAAAATAGCALEKITIPQGQRVLVVQGVLTLDPAAPQQTIVVEWSLTGTVEVPDQDSVRGVLPPVPVTGAIVRVTRDDSLSVSFAESDTAGIYTLDAAAAAPFLQAGRVYRLLVRTPEGVEARGRMRMPGFPIVSGVPPEGSSFNRDRDTLRVEWAGGGSTKGVFVQVRPRDIERRLTLFFFTDSARFRIAGNMPLPFAGDEHPPVVWVKGTRQTFTVAAVDTNLFDFARSGNNPFTGAGFLNRIEGALGVFGGVAPVNRTFEVVGDSGHVLEGRYRLDGSLATGDTIIGELRLFVTRDGPAPLLVATLVDNPAGWLLPRAEGAGRVSSGTLRLELYRDPEGVEVARERLVLTGPFGAQSVTQGTIAGVDGAASGSYRLERLGGLP